MKRDNSDSVNDAPPSKSSRPSGDSSNVVVRFLIPRRAAGIMIGKGGDNIKRVRTQYNVRVNIPDCRGPERIMTCEGDLQSICDVMQECSPKLRDILDAKASDPKRIMGYPPRKWRSENGEEENDDNMLDYRILVHESQAGSVIGRGGDRIKELRRKHKLRVIKVYEMRAPYSTDRVVQIVSEPESALKCLRAVVEAVEAAPPRGRRDDYNAANFNEMEALNYGGWLSTEAIEAFSRGGGPPAPPGYSRNSYGDGMGYGGPPGGGMYQMPSSGGRGRSSRGSRGSSFGQASGGYGDYSGSGYGNGADPSSMYGDGYNYMSNATGYPGTAGPGGYDSSASGRSGTYAGWGTSAPAGQDISKTNQWSGGWS